MQRGRKKADYLLVLAPLVYLAVSVCVVMLVCRNGLYPEGGDAVHHIYRGELLYNSIREGNWWPVYDPMWYNGVEPLRYWAPLPAYFMALCQAFAGGSALNGYLIYVGLVCFAGGLAWYFVGCCRGRPWMGALLGLLWFFMPCNLLATFNDGNLPMSLCLAFLPVVLHTVNAYVEAPGWKRLPAITLCFVLMGLCHLGFALMTALAMMVYLLLRRFIVGGNRSAAEVIPAMLLGFAVLGVWLWGALVGGITSMDKSEVMLTYFQDALVSLNPLARVDNIHTDYFGLAAFCLAVLGGLCSHKKSMTGFWTALFIFLCTTTTMRPLIAFLPGGQYLWMMRFVPIAACMILYSFLTWETLRRPIAALILVLLCVDTLPSMKLIYGTRNGEMVSERLDTLQITTLTGEAQEITGQRLALMDESGLGSIGAWLVSSWNKPVPGTFGVGWDAAATASNIMQLNRALTQGYYLYLFDRCQELGNDSVVVLTSRLDKERAPVEKLDSAASRLGYRLADYNEGYRLYHLDEEGSWGTTATYRAIAIGSASSGLALQFPAMREAASPNLNDYTFEELSAYDIIYLSGFTYDDRAYAEKLVQDLSEAGVHIVIAADGIPEDRKSHDRSFLGVVCNFIEFKNGYPPLNTVDGVLYTDLFPKGYTDWKTVYLEGLDECWGTVQDNDLTLNFYGTVKNDNIVVIGLNLTYFFGLTRDASVGQLLSRAMNLSSGELPRREIVPLEISRSPEMITVTSPQSNVNTGLAYLDIFESDREIQAEDHLVVVGQGTTHIALRYPYFREGLCVTVAGLILMVIQWAVVRKRRQRIEQAAKEVFVLPDISEFSIIQVAPAEEAEPAAAAESGKGDAADGPENHLGEGEK